MYEEIFLNDVFVLFFAAQQCNTRQNDSANTSNQNAHPNEIYPRSPLV